MTRKIQLGWEVVFEEEVYYFCNDLGTFRYNSTVPVSSPHIIDFSFSSGRKNKKLLFSGGFPSDNVFMKLFRRLEAGEKIDTYEEFLYKVRRHKEEYDFDSMDDATASYKLIHNLL